MKGIAIFGGLALFAGASAQVGEYVATDGGYRIEMSIRPKGVWTFKTQFVRKPNKTGTGRWMRKGRQLFCTVYQNGRALHGPEGSGVLTLAADGKSMTQRVAGHTIVFRKVVAKR